MKSRQAPVPIFFLAPGRGEGWRIEARAGSLAAAFLFASTLGSLGAAPAPPEIPPGMAVTAAKAKNACFSDTLDVVGSVVPRNEILVRPDREGLQLSTIAVEAGDTVTSGQVLARLAPPGGHEGGVAVTAPAAGIVLAAPTVIGEAVSARGAPLFRIAADGDLDLSAEVPAADASRLAIGQSAKVKVAGIDEASGHVRLASSSVDPTTQLGRVRISLQHNPALRVGASGQAAIDLADSCGVSIPLSALLFDPGGPVVQVVREDRIETRRVTIGLYGQSDVEIRDGLAVGDLIVVRAGAFLREGDPVRPVLRGD